MDTNLGLDQDLINAVTQIVESSCSSKKMEKEELHPNQVKLDKNKNGKLDSDDFKKLRKEEETDENYVSHAQRKAVWASKNEKGVKEEVEELDELSKKTLGSYVKKASTSLASNAMKAADRTDKKSFTKAVNRMSGIQNAADKLTKEEVEEFMQTEEYEQLDELSKDTLKSYVAKAEPQADKLSDKYSTQRFKRDKTHGQFSDDTPALAKLGHKAAKRDDGVYLAKKKLNKEQMEEIEALAAKHGLGE
jgi:hypothetical protein